MTSIPSRSADTGHPTAPPAPGCSLCRSPGSIPIWHRAYDRVEYEQVYQQWFLDLLYRRRRASWMSDLIAGTRAFSRIYGSLQDSRWSRRHIAAFVSALGIATAEFEPLDYRSFNGFFARRFRPGVRMFADAPNFPAPAEGRYLADRNNLSLPVKGYLISLPRLLGGRCDAAPFEHGPRLVIRLAPADYHRVHFPDDGRILHRFTINGHLHAVHPIARSVRPDVLLGNERHVTILATRHFGRLAIVEVGALCVGKIVQLNPAANVVHRGAEKAYFKFGGSAVVVLGEHGAWEPHPDICQQTLTDRETFVRLGEPVAGYPTS